MHMQTFAAFTRGQPIVTTSPTGYALVDQLRAAGFVIDQRRLDRVFNDAKGPITGNIALTLAARTPGTVMNDITGDAPQAVLKLRTPAGVIETWSEELDGSLLVGVDRTARTIASSIIHLPETLGNVVEASLATATR